MEKKNRFLVSACAKYAAVLQIGALKKNSNYGADAAAGGISAPVLLSVV